MSRAAEQLQPSEKAYRARPGFQITDEDAQVIGEFCEGLVAKHGSVSPRLFVEAARGDRRVNKYLDWNDDAAAHKWRLHQAARLLVSFTVTIQREEREVEVTAFQYVDQERGRLPAAQVFNDQEMRTLVIARAKRDAIAWYHRYRNIAEADELAPIFKGIEKALAAELAQGPPRAGGRPCSVCKKVGHYAVTCPEAAARRHAAAE